MLGEWSRISEVAVVISETTEKGEVREAQKRVLSRGFSFSYVFVCTLLNHVYLVFSSVLRV